jgi:hypothetical protein
MKGVSIDVQLVPNLTFHEKEGELFWIQTLMVNNVKTF